MVANTLNKQQLHFISHHRCRCLLFILLRRFPTVEHISSDQGMRTPQETASAKCTGKINTSPASVIINGSSDLVTATVFNGIDSVLAVPEPI